MQSEITRAIISGAGKVNPNELVLRAGRIRCRGCETAVEQKCNLLS